ncbi:MAG: copper resistance protein NlpE N-terminal domain-containing protein [Bacteroidetes bacterium]|nr:copper resistance protein NlpE N-terminal domain-containing protein [Bacteroidota bacterium]
MRLILVIVFCLVSAGIYAASDDTLTDTFEGTIAARGCSGVKVTLQLRHEPYADDGLYTLTEQYCRHPKAVVLRGSWTVLRGDAVNENATVVELWDDATNRPIRHYLRLRNGDIKVLDEKLRLMRGKGSYVLKRQ